MATSDETLDKWLMAPKAESTTQTLIVVILDESGSMAVQKSDVIGGFNAFLDSQKELKTDKARLMLIKFNASVTVVHQALDLGIVPQLTPQNYFPGCGTALYDAVADGIKAGEENALPTERVLVLIMTDGEENMSKKSTAAAIKKLIKEKEDTGRWTFAYIGENPGAWAVNMDQPQQNVVPYDLTVQRNNFTVAAVSANSFRTSSAPRTKTFFNPTV